MRRYAEDKTVVGVSPLARMRVVGVELQLHSVGVQVKHVRVAVGVRKYTGRHPCHHPA